MSRGSAALSVLMIALLGYAGVLPAFTGESPDPVPSLPEQPAKQTVTPARLQRAIQRYLSKRWDGRVSKVEVQVITPRGAIRLPAGRLSIRVTPIAVVVRPGPARFRVALAVDGVVARKLKVAASIKAYARIVLTTRAIQRGEVLNAADLTISEWRILDIEHGLVVSPEEAIGKRIRLDRSPHKPIPRVALEARDESSGERGQGTLARPMVLASVPNQISRAD